MTNTNDKVVIAKDSSSTTRVVYVDVYVYVPLKGSGYNKDSNNNVKSILQCVVVVLVLLLVIFNDVITRISM